MEGDESVSAGCQFRGNSSAIRRAVWSAMRMFRQTVLAIVRERYTDFGSAFPSGLPDQNGLESAISRSSFADDRFVDGKRTGPDRGH
jgi:hypothetical protein